MTAKHERLYYTYLIIDPRNGVVFYVGKGTGDRANDHVRQVVRSKIAVSDKHKKIAEILAIGMKPIVSICETFEDESDALDHEESLIKHYGLENLTNVMSKGAPSIDPIRYSIEVGQRLLNEATRMLSIEANESRRDVWAGCAKSASLLIEKAISIGSMHGKAYS